MPLRRLLRYRYQRSNVTELTQVSANKHLFTTARFGVVGLAQRFVDTCEEDIASPNSAQRVHHE
jgi:hypothetical protein